MDGGQAYSILLGFEDSGLEREDTRDTVEGDEDELENVPGEIDDNGNKFGDNGEEGKGSPGGVRSLGDTEIVRYESELGDRDKRSGRCCSM